MLEILKLWNDCKVEVYVPYTKIVTDVILVGDRKELKSFEENLAKEAKTTVENMVTYKISNDNGKQIYVSFSGSRAMIGLSIEEW